jgi:hypothetical protein
MLLTAGAVMLPALFLAKGSAHAQTASPLASSAAPSPDADAFACFALAAESLKASKLYPPTEARDATLAQKRAALADPSVQRALTLLRIGLNRPNRVSEDLGNQFPQFANVRTLARLLAVELYVAFADGRTRAALSTVDDGLRLGYAAKPAGTIGALVGAAVDAIVLNLFARHLDQLSARDCELLLLQMRRYLSLPDPVLAAWRAERAYGMRSVIAPLLEAFSKEDLTGDLEGIGDMKELTPAQRAEFAALRTDPAARAAFVAALRRRFEAVYDSAEAEYRAGPARPAAAAAVSAPSATPPPSGRGLADVIGDGLAPGILPVMSRTAQRMHENQAHARLLAVHAALRRYRWEYNRYPERLDELNLGALAADPFTGGLLTYARLPDGSGYTLESIGPPELDDTGKPLGDKRRKVTLPLTPARPATPPPAP